MRWFKDDINAARKELGLSKSDIPSPTKPINTNEQDQLRELGDEASGFGNNGDKKKKDK
jgi:hypothetical protein